MKKKQGRPRKYKAKTKKVSVSFNPDNLKYLKKKYGNVSGKINELIERDRDENSNS